MSLAREGARAREAFIIDHSTLLVIVHGAFSTPLCYLGLLFRRLAGFIPVLAVCSPLLAFLRLNLMGLIIYDERKIYQETVPSLSAVLPFTHFFPERMSLQLPNCA